MQKAPKSRAAYVQWYYFLYADGNVDQEILTTGKFLAQNVQGKTLDCGCGPVPQLWALCMPRATEIHAIDLPKESIIFVQKKLKEKNRWWKKFTSYKEFLEEVEGKLPSNYIPQQINKLKSVQQADMTKHLPFPDKSFDTVISLYSLGVLKNEKVLEQAIQEIFRVLKKGGKLLHINTNGRNSNLILPEYTWQGLPQQTNLLTSLLRKKGFSTIRLKTKDIGQHTAYIYNKISLLSAIRP
ncbi:MAG: class I SAM-dependent methyltransferase [Nanoarchaeota archaeon]|nr:class I SAM-dependent methyltransferase [Nanoarchaeota archaeon]